MFLRESNDQKSAPVWAQEMSSRKKLKKYHKSKNTLWSLSSLPPRDLEEVKNESQAKPNRSKRKTKQKGIDGSTDMIDLSAPNEKDPYESHLSSRSVGAHFQECSLVHICKSAPRFTFVRVSLEFKTEFVKSREIKDINYQNKFKLTFYSRFDTRVKTE